LQKKNYEPVLVQNNILFEPDHQSESDHSNAVVSKENLNETESSYEKPYIPKTFRRPWEEIGHNKQKNSLGYKEDILDVSFHIPYFSKPVQF